MYASKDPEKVNPNSYSVLCFASKMPMILTSINYKIRFASRQMKGMHKKVENMRNRRSLQGNLQVTLIGSGFHYCPSNRKFHCFGANVAIASSSLSVKQPIQIIYFATINKVHVLSNRTTGLYVR